MVLKIKKYLILGTIMLLAESAFGVEACKIPFYQGIDTTEGLHIPRKGFYNPLLKDLFGSSNENFGDPVTYQGCQFVKGAASSFGGPNDTTIGKKEEGALTGEVLSLLNNPENPPAEMIASDPGKYYYAAMRLRYSSKSIKLWQAARLIVINPKNGRAVALRIVDWGPGPSGAHRIIDISPQGLIDLGLVTDQKPIVALGSPDTPLGVLSYLTTP